MNIITEVTKNGRIQDGIATILKLDDETFERVIERMRPLNGQMEEFNFYYVTDSCTRPDRASQLGLEEFNIDGKEVVRGYYASGSQISVQELFPMFEKLLAGFPEGSSLHTRLVRLLETRGLEAFKENYVNTNYSANSDVVNKVFEILSNQELFDKFLDYDHNQESFEIEGVKSPKHEICTAIWRIFGEIHDNDTSRELENTKAHFYIPELPKMQERVKEAYEKINFNRYIGGMYEFRSPVSGTAISRKGEEPDFEINQDLVSAVYDGMPKDLSLEEKATYVYAKLCKLLLYDEGALYKRRMERADYITPYSKEVMEAIIPGSKVDCVNFSRMFARFVNQFDGDIGAVVLASGEGSRMHSFVGLYTENVSASFDGTGTQAGGVSDDLMKAKLGLPLYGIVARYDKDRVLSNAVKKVYPMVLGREPITQAEYMKAFETKSNIEVGRDNLGDVLKLAVKIGKERGLAGNELTQFLDAVSHMEVFDPYLEKFYIGQKTERDGEKSFDRVILFRRSSFGLENDNPFYAIETKSGEVKELDKEGVKREYRGCEWESELHKCEDVDLSEGVEENKKDKNQNVATNPPSVPEDHGDR